MVQYNRVNTKLSNLQLSKLKNAAKNNEGTTLRMGNKNFNKEKLPHELLLTTRQTTKLRYSIQNNMSADAKFSKAQIKKRIQSGSFLGKLLGRFLSKLIKLAISVGKNLLASLGLSAAISAADAGIQKSIFGSGITTLKIGNKELNDLMKIIKVLENHGVLLKGITKTVQNDVKSQRGDFLSVLLGTLGASLLGDVLSKGLLGSGMYRAGEGKGIVRAGEEIRKKKSLMLAHPLTNFEIQDYYKNGVNSRNNLSKIKNGAYILNLMNALILKHIGLLYLNRTIKLFTLMVWV